MKSVVYCCRLIAGDEFNGSQFSTGNDSRRPEIPIRSPRGSFYALYWWRWSRNEMGHTREDGREGARSRWFSFGYSVTGFLATLRLQLVESGYNLLDPLTLVWPWSEGVTLYLLDRLMNRLSTELRKLTCENVNDCFHFWLDSSINRPTWGKKMRRNSVCWPSGIQWKTVKNQNQSTQKGKKVHCGLFLSRNSIKKPSKRADARKGNGGSKLCDRQQVAGR